MATVSEFKKKHGDLISEYGKQHNIDENILGGFILVESRGSGFENDKLVIRFENHCFLKGDAAKYKGVYFDYSPQKKFTGHVYRRDPKKEWNKCHEDQSVEYDAFDFAISLNSDNAYEATSYGLAQIMGFNYETCNYSSAKEMYDDFSTGEEAQLKGFISFIVNNSNLLTACRNKDFKKMAKYYNGPGAVDTYAPNLEKKYNEYKDCQVKDCKVKE